MAIEVGIKAIPYNLPMRQARLEAGLTQAQLAKMTGLSTSAISGIERLCMAVNERQATEIALVLGYDVDYLFPLETRSFKSVKTRSIEFVTIVESLDALPPGEFATLYLPSPEQIFENKEMKEMVRAKLKTLTASEQAVLNLRFGFSQERPMTLEEAGAKLHISRELVRQIEQRAFRKLRHPGRSRDLRNFLCPCF